MSTSAVSSATNSQGTSSSAFGLLNGSEKSMGQQEFLKLLVAQLKNQDPLKPQDNTEFVAQLAQFSNLEQTMGINSRLDNLTIQARGQSNAQVLGIVGQTATVKGSVVTSTQAVGFTLSGPTAKTTVNISDSSGRVVRSIELGAKNAGYVATSWDGRDMAGILQPQGSYNIQVTATNANGGAVAVDQHTSGTVKSISFDQGYPVLNLDNGAQAPVSDLLRVDSPPISP